MMAGRRRDIARDRPEPSWIGRAKIWTWLLNAALAVRDLARFRPVQYLAALIFIGSSVGMIVALWFVISILLSMAQVDTGSPSTTEGLFMYLLAPGAAWLVVSALLGILRGLFSGRRSCSLPLFVLRFMGSPARESLKAWDGIFFRVDKKIGKTIAGPLLWLLRKPYRFITAAVVLTAAFLAIAYGLLVPAELVAWGNQYGSGLRAVGGGGFTFVLLLVIVVLIGMLAFMLLVVYVWFRSALVALPSLLLFVLSLAKEFAEWKAYWGPMVGLVTYVPPGIAEAYNTPVESWPAAVVVSLSRVFVGSPGFPTTIGMILTGVLMGWLPYVLEQLDKPTPRDVVVRHGWTAATDYAAVARKHRVFVHSLWGGGLVIFFFSLAPVGYLLSPMERAGWIVAMLVIIPVATGLLILRAIVKKSRKSGRATRPQPLDMSIDEKPGTPGEPEKLTAIEDNYSPLGRLLSEAQRRRSVRPVEEPLGQDQDGPKV